jgi:single stranded DNA-binding protein
VAVSGRREQEASFFAVVVWRDQAEHAAESLAKGSRVVVMGRLQQRAWTAEDGSARSVVEVVAEELGPSLRWATATTTRATRSQVRWVGDHGRGVHVDMSEPRLESVQMMRGQSGPFSGVRLGDAMAYEFELDEALVPRPGMTRLERWLAGRRPRRTRRCRRRWS